MDDRMIIVQKSLAWCFTILLLVGPVVAGPASGELYSAWGSTDVVFPECGMPDSMACGYPLSILVSEQTPFRFHNDPPNLSVLPKPVLSAVLLAIEIQAATCPVETLTDQFAMWEVQSTKEPETLIGTGVPEILEKCFEGGIESAHEQSIILLWKDGDVHGWSQCDGMACSFDVHPPTNYFKAGELPISVGVGVISYHAYGRFFENMGEVVANLLSRAPMQVQQQYREWQIDEPDMDDLALEMLRAADTSG